MGNVNQQPQHRTKREGLAVIFAFALAGPVFAGGASNEVFAARAEAEFHRAQTQFQSNPNDSAVAWHFARACFDLADLATNETRRADIARQGIIACRELLARETNSAPGHYYLAMNYGQLAKAEAPSLAAYRLVREMEREFKTAADLDAGFDYAGPERSLGLLYRDAPGWPFSIGSKRKAREFLERADTLAPDYPENPLNLAETYLRWRDLDRARSELDALDALWPKARTNFTGTAWEQSWDDWSARRNAVREKLGELLAPAKPPKDGR
jgi:tetratricopeptide (TPR) repeat protein